MDLVGYVVYIGNILYIPQTQMSPLTHWPLEDVPNALKI